MNKPFAIAMTLLAASAAANAQVIAQWNFNSLVPDNSTATGSLLPSVGSGSAALVGTTGSFASGSANGGSSDPAPATDNSGWGTTGYAAQGTGDRTRGVQFNVSTVGSSLIAVSWDQRLSNTAARSAQFQYSLNGTTFTDFGTVFSGSPGDTWFNNRSVDLSSVPGVGNNANFAFRIVAAFEPSTSTYLAATPASTYATTGTWRFDMATVTAVPEPGTYAMMLAGLAMIGFMAARRRG